MKDIKKQLQRKYPFMRKVGTVSSTFDKNDVLQKYRNEKLLVLMVGVQGSGKTTFCQKNFAEYDVRNLDDILVEYLESNPQFSMEDNIAINKIFLERIDNDLKKSKIGIADVGALNMPFRVNVLNYLKDNYTRAVLIVLNPPLMQIIKQVEGQMSVRSRPGLWEDIREEYQFLQFQIEEGFLQMGVDEVFML